MMRPFNNPETLMLPPLNQQLEAVLGTLTLTQRRLLLLSQGRGFTASDIQSAGPALGLPEMGSEQVYSLLGTLFELVQQYQQELESAVRVQQKLLPERPPDLPGLLIAVRYLPRLGVSGDYYDFLPLGEGQVGLALGDVSGKGMGAAMLMASVRAALRAWVEANPSLPSPLVGEGPGVRGSERVGRLLAHLNGIVHRDAPRRHFVTLIYGILDASVHTFTCSTAGHPPVLHYHAATEHLHELETGGGILGIWEGQVYPAETVSLGRGDVLVLYTDGVTEAMDANEELFGLDRLCDVVTAHGGESPEGMIEAILSAVSQFAPQGWEDDVTVMVVKRDA